MRKWSPAMATPEQFNDLTRRNKSHLDPVKSLMLAVLAEALREYMRRPRSRPEILYWMRHQGPGPFAFHAICEALEYPAEKILRRAEELTIKKVPKHSELTNYGHGDMMVGA
jgi:hypothetical protein